MFRFSNRFTLVFVSTDGEFGEDTTSEVQIIAHKSSLSWSGVVQITEWMYDYTRANKDEVLRTRHRLFAPGPAPFVICDLLCAAPQVRISLLELHQGGRAQMRDYLRSMLRPHSRTSLKRNTLIAGRKRATVTHLYHPTTNLMYPGNKS
jgi:hypothetical protein